MNMKVAAFIVSEKTSNSYRYTIDLKISAEILADTYPVARSVFNLEGAIGILAPFFKQPHAKDRLNHL